MEPYRCVVCQEEITPKEHSYSTKLFNMALCRKHQDIQKQIRTKAETEQKTNSIRPESKINSEIQKNYCVVCQEEITPKEHSYSTKLFNMALCRKHQDIQKQIRSKAETEQKTNSKEPEVKTTSNIESKKPEIPIQKANISEKSEDTLIQWLIQWANDKKVDLESKQFFLGSKLGRLAEDIIGKAQEEILLTSPYVEKSSLGEALQEARGRRVTIKLVARRPEKKDLSKVDFQTNLKNTGIVIHYINSIHSKIIVIDRKVAIISSMNLTSNSFAGGSDEAGIVSIERKVVDSATKFITDFLEKPESTDASSPSYYNRFSRYR
jgi:hypothetical protein